MENALLGDSMIEKLKEEGTSLEQQKEAALGTAAVHTEAITIQRPVQTN